MTSMTEARRRRGDAQRVASHARIVADMLAATAELGIEPPDSFGMYAFLRAPTASWVIFNEDDQKDRAAAIIRGIGGKWDKRADERFTFTSEFLGVKLSLTVSRESVCERVVTGATEVTTPAVAAVPERTETVETVEWVCAPILSAVSA